jgi:RNA polymerase sigma-70 factor (family 1)
LSVRENYIVNTIREWQDGIAAGDESAFGQLYLHFSKKLLQFAVSLTRSRQIAEELVEDVFVRLWANRLSIQKIENLTVYLYVSVKNRALNTLSQKAHELVTAPFDYLDVTVDEFAPDPYDLLITAEMMTRMHEAIDSLPPRCKIIFKLIRENGLKYKEVSEILNISVNTIDAQMAIAVKKICTSLHLEKPGKSFFPSLPGAGQKNQKNNKND